MGNVRLTIANTRIHIPLRIAVDAIRKPIVAVREDLPICQALAVRRNIEAVDVRWRGGVVFAREGANAGVRHVNVLVVWTDLNAVGSDEIVGYCLHETSVGLEAVDLWPNAGSRTEVSGRMSALRYASSPIRRAPTANNHSGHL